MRKQPTGKSWEATLKSIKRSKGWQQSIPSEQRLDDFAGLLTLPLPPTYRQFTRRLGAGQLSGWCEFFSCAAGISSGWDMFHANLNHKKFIIDFYEMAAERARQLVLFGRFWSGHEFGWCPQEVTRKKKQALEYAIYSVSRDLQYTTKLAETFPEFIGDFCMGDKLISHLGLDQMLYPRNEYNSRG